jgi:poly(3-hydroxybutyrate) depolymerase
MDMGGRFRRVGVLLSMGAWAAACTSDGSDYAEACATPDDGVCDELAGCPLGSDSVDCDAVCSESPWSDEMVGVCAHDLATSESESAPNPDLGSGGSGGPVGTWDGTVTVRGAYSTDQVDRHYRVYIPRRNDPDRPTAVVFALGGFTVDMYWLAEFTELNRLADREDLIVIYGQPEWRDFTSYWVFGWYVYEQAHQGSWEDNPDIAYLETVLGEVSELYNVDHSRVYVTGHSRGAALSIIAAHERPDLFAGYCAQAGFTGANDYEDRIEELALETPPAGYLVHGEDDPDVDVDESDDLSELFDEMGYIRGKDYAYRRIENATHEWQSQYNQHVWDFLDARSLGSER